MLNIGEAARRPEGPSVLAGFINLIINNNKCKKKNKAKQPKIKGKECTHMKHI